MNDLRRVVGVLVASLAATWLPAIRAEVAVTGGGAGNYKLHRLSLTDDTDPVGISWVRYHADSPSWVVLNEQGYVNGDGLPSMLMMVDGLPLVAWSRNSAQGRDIVLSRFESGAWSAPQALAGLPLDEHDPFLFADPSNGSVHLVYWVADTPPRVMHRQAPADLSAWSTPTQVSQPGEPGCRPSGVVHDGVLRIVYENHDSGIGAAPRQIMVATHIGTAFVSQMLAVTLHAEANWPQLHVARGRLWVDWIDSAGTMAWIRLEAGSWGVVQTHGYQGVEDRDFLVRGRIRRLVID